MSPSPDNTVGKRSNTLYPDLDLVAILEQVTGFDAATTGEGPGAKEFAWLERLTERCMGKDFS
jgi:hypothetical protein